MYSIGAKKLINSLRDNVNSKLNIMQIYFDVSHRNISFKDIQKTLPQDIFLMISPSKNAEILQPNLKNLPS